MTTTRRRTATALSLAATATLTVALSTLSIPAAHAQRVDTGYGHAAPGTTDIGAIVAFRKAQQAQYLVDHGLLALR